MDAKLIAKQGPGGFVIKEINRYTIIVFDALLDCSEKFNREYVLTEGWRPGSGYHPQHMAWDVRAKGIPAEHRKEIFLYLRQILPVYFDVVLEEFPLDSDRDHFHIECDLKKLADFILEK